MPEQVNYVKLSNLVGQEMTVNKVFGYKYKMWNNETKKMEVADTWQEGYRKVWQVETDKGQLDLSQAQLGGMLEGMCHGGKSDVIGGVFSIKSNGKSGMDIRYFINPVRMAKKEEVKQETESQPFDW